MDKRQSVLAIGAAGAVLASGMVAGPGAGRSSASNHLDAPSQVADNQMDTSDVYLFTSPDDPDSVTAICNWVAFEIPARLLPWYRFVTNGHYEFHVDNSGDGQPEFTFRFTFKSGDGQPDPPPRRAELPRGVTADKVPWAPKGTLKDGPSAGPSLNEIAADGLQRAAERASRNGADPYAVKYAEAERRRRLATMRKSGAVQGADQTYTVELIRPGKDTTVLAKDVRAPEGMGDRPKSGATKTTTPGVEVFAGRVRDPFFWWLPTNVHSIAIKLPKKLIALKGDPVRNPVIGMWMNAFRGSVNLRTRKRTVRQVSRHALSGFSSVVLPAQMRDYYHLASSPATDPSWKDMQNWVATGSGGSLFGIAALPILPAAGKNFQNMYLHGFAPGVGRFKEGLNSHALNKDLDAQNLPPNEQIRLNMSVPTSSAPKRHGALDNDQAGYPNGRRLTDDTIGAFARIATGEPTTPATIGGILSVLPLSGLEPPRGEGFPYLHPPWL